MVANRECIIFRSTREVQVYKKRGCTSDRPSNQYPGNQYAGVARRWDSHSSHDLKLPVTISSPSRCCFVVAPRCMYLVPVRTLRGLPKGVVVRGWFMWLSMVGRITLPCIAAEILTIGARHVVRPPVCVNLLPRYPTRAGEGAYRMGRIGPSMHTGLVRSAPPFLLNQGSCWLNDEMTLVQNLANRQYQRKIT